VALVTRYVSEECIVYIIMAKRISELGTLMIISNESTITLMMEAIGSSETLVLTTVTWLHTPEDGILHSHRCENLKSYIALTGWTL
jgi:hypothetical protein